MALYALPRAIVRLNGAETGVFVDLKVTSTDRSATLIGTDDDGDEVIRLSMTRERLEAVLDQLDPTRKENDADTR